MILEHVKKKKGERPVHVLIWNVGRCSSLSV